ncbi:hypothetical protein [Pseudomonas sp. P8_250]|uniref:hypothetical protein n=1 Tax=Pseudomonas sp. P8_250 TaxID=3043446 RepID=UPI002A363377|nr:hypothetical protein [Pseudomonas sp. P8_250]MDX9668723.1 hypothetical protein [Pseudomonas sp. P8_250]
MIKMTDADHAEFALWFVANTDIPEGVEVFDCTEDGMYVWEETRNGLVRWMELKVTMARIDAAPKFRVRIFWTLGEDGRTPAATEDVASWTEWMKDEKARRVALDVDYVNRVAVSTIFLGISTDMFSDTPALFQTLVFGGPKEGHQMRYKTWDEAEKGHRQVCELAGIKKLLH